MMPAVLCVCLSNPAHAATGATGSFVHLSDVHIEATLQPVTEQQLAGARSYKAVRTLKGLGQVELAPYGITAPRPEFILCTGDATEFGFGGATWKTVEQYFGDLGLPVEFASGNHDHTWVSSQMPFHTHDGQRNYSFDAFDCHFIVLSSATLQDPMPSFGEEVLQFLQKDLKKQNPNTKMFVCCHHPLDTSEFCSRYDVDRVLDEVRPYNVLALLYGHGHSATKTEYYGLDAIQGGSTFVSKNGGVKEAGYNIIYVTRNRLVAAYKIADQSSATQPLMDKEIPAKSAYPAIAIDSPRQKEQIRRNQLQIEAEIGRDAKDITGARYDIDDETSGDLHLDGRRAKGTVSLSDLRNGAHYLRVTLNGRKGIAGYRTACFFLDRADKKYGLARWRYQMQGGSKATPLVRDGRVYVGANDGRFYALDAHSGKELWRFDAGSEILSSAAMVKNTIVFGSASGKMYGLSTEGHRKWVFDANDSAFSSPVADEEGNVYFGTNGARLIALNAETGQMLWSFADAQYSIESKPCVYKDRVYFGAWDGNVYCLDRKTGKQVWKEFGPKARSASSAVARRYVAPGDCGPVATDAGVFVTDRGYVAGKYDLDGKYTDTISTSCASLCLSADGKALYLRARPAVKVGLDGKQIWETEIKAGNNPAAPAEYDGNMYLCSGAGHLYVVDGATGTTKWEYQVTPKLYMMSTPAYDQGTVFTTGLDGYVTAIQRP